METVIKKTVKGKTMEAVFDKTQIVNIRYFQALDIPEEGYDEEKTYTFEIKIRHNEGESPKRLFNKAVKEIEKS